MSSHPFSRSAAAFTQNLTGLAGLPTLDPTLSERIAALELLLQQLVFVLDARGGAFNQDDLDAWLTTCVNRMHATASAPAQEIAALERLRQLVSA